MKEQGYQDNHKIYRAKKTPINFETINSLFCCSNNISPFPYNRNLQLCICHLPTQPKSKSNPNPNPNPFNNLFHTLNRRRKSLCKDFLCQLRQNVPPHIRIQCLKHLIHTLPMTISNSTQSVTSYQSSYCTRNIG